MRALVHFVIKYGKIPGIIMRLIRRVDQGFIKVEYDQDLFDGFLLFVR